MKYYNKERSLSALAALLTFSLFAIGILSVLLGGAGVYRRLTARNTKSYDSRTCAQYLATKLRQASSPDAVSVVTFGEGDALVISERIANEQYMTQIYCHKGWLMELFTVASGNFSPEDGEKILPLDSLSFSHKGSLIHISLTGTTGAIGDITLHIRGSEGTQP